jgi:hypothetical protein
MHVGTDERYQSSPWYQKPRHGDSIAPQMTTPENSTVVVAGSIGVYNIRIRSWLFPMVDDDGSENWEKNGKEGRKCHTNKSNIV